VTEHNLTVIQKYDGRTQKHHDAVETEALDERILLALVEHLLTELLPVPDALNTVSGHEKDLRKQVIGAVKKRVGEEE
jgi:plasmid stability protein